MTSTTQAQPATLTARDLQDLSELVTDAQIEVNRQAHDSRISGARAALVAEGKRLAALRDRIHATDHATVQIELGGCTVSLQFEPGEEPDAQADLADLLERAAVIARGARQFYPNTARVEA